MMTQFDNEQIWLSNIPKSETIEFTGLLPKYKRLQNIQWALFFLIGLILLTGAYFKLSEVDGVWFGVALLIWFVFIVLKFTFIQLGFSKKAYAIRQKDLHYKTGYFTHKHITVPFNRIQHVEIRQGLISKSMNIAVLKIFTAGNSAHDLSLKGISLETANEIKQFVTSKVSQDV